MNESIPPLGCYSETLPIDELLSKHVLRLASRFRLKVAYKVDLPVHPIQKNDPYWIGIRRFIEEYSESGATPLLWPLLSKNQGYWLNERNALQYRDALMLMLDWTDRNGIQVPGMIYDVETPWYQTRIALDAQNNPLKRFAGLAFSVLSNRNPLRFLHASQTIQTIVDLQHQKLGVSYTATFPLLMADLAVRGFRLQDLFEMPVFSVSFDNYNLMMYTSYLADLLPGISPRDLGHMVYEYALMLTSHFGEHGQMTFGSTYEAVLPGKPLNTYGGPQDMAEHVAAAKAGGVEEFWIYCLEGTLYRDRQGTNRLSEAESNAWFETLIQTEPKVPEPSKRFELLHKLVLIFNRDPLGRLLMGGTRKSWI